MTSPNDRVRILTEALPYIQRFRDAVIVIKYGGNAMTDEALKHSFARDAVLLKAVGMHPVIVHGGGPRISKRLEEHGLSSRFVHGIRVTDEAVIKVVTEVLSEINGEISRSIEEHEGRAVSLTSEQGMIRAQKFERPDDDTDFGFAGVVTGVAPTLARTATEERTIPVLTPVGVGRDGLPYNINADLSASGVARALAARKLILMTNTAGVLDGDGELITDITVQLMAKLINDGVIREGMLPKLRCAFDAVREGVDAAHIIDGRVQHALLLELLTDTGVGTLITT